MINIRKGVFETNSSSTHSLTICSAEEYDKFIKGEYYYDEFNDVFLTKEEVNRKFNEYLNDYEDEIGTDKAELFKDFLQYKYIYKYESFGEGYEDLYTSYTTKNGDRVVAFGYFGYD